MNIAQEDFVIAKIGEKKKDLLFVTKLSKDGLSLSGVTEKTRHTEDPKDFEIQINDVLANLGPKPKKGTVHGVKVEIFRKSVDIPNWGNSDWYTLPPKELQLRIKEAFAKAFTIIKKHGLIGVLPVNIEIHPSTGKMAGCYKCSKKDPTEFPDVLTLFPRTEKEKEEKLDFLYIILHEYAHGIDFRLFHSPKGKAQWIKLYNEMFELKKISEEDLENMYESLVAADSSVEEFKKSLSDDFEIRLFKNILKYIQKSYHLGPRDLNVLLATKDPLLKDIFPDHEEVIDIDTTYVTAYATKKVAEFFAESVSFYLQGKKLPKNVTTLVEKTLQSIAGNRRQ